jgi:two-component system CheB/CheR fusion protein
MDEMNGYELVTHIRKRFTPTELPAIALTGYGRMSDEHSALNGGYNAHLAKPASLEDLMEVIAQLLELRGAQ